MVRDDFVRSPPPFVARVARATQLAAPAPDAGQLARVEADSLEVRNVPVTPS